ncbi:MAG: hypothetical protein FWE95_05435, partial [Planctomycetaceae bacterium]|nr:hypothetical protein [Planctomycetaceae bacterium]
VMTNVEKMSALFLVVCGVFSPLPSIGSSARTFWSSWTLRAIFPKSRKCSGAELPGYFTIGRFGSSALR